MKTLLVRPPSSRLAEGQITHIAKPASVSYTAALAQWQAYLDIFRAEGWAVVQVPVADDCPDCVFVEDAVVMFGDVAVITAPGTPSRAAEPVAVEAAIRARLPHIRVHSITGDGTLDGGDVLKVGKDVYVGLGGRTNGEGIKQLRRIVHAEGYTLHAVPVTKALHLKSAVTALPDGTVIGYLPIVDNPHIFPRFMPIPEEHGVAVVVLSDEHVLMSSDAPETAALLRRMGYTVTTAGISEFEALEGCVTCLSVRVR
ncbi:dimethylargininase [Cutaneotrichosporon oleaginosum]|uniref:Dimethylargininase n=1 Tax=Cutaneotrichosporon oleaginosum TaxID=879819 RepID=A0A0J0XML2_9TREE|nr:dimethylargininase [Cutaneotrichosporon oleaginosum]KLT42327.1 dimethylargininase [Cutaneotrichosporon oleaginosum]TXT04147.1 hypothetical protein COLE_07844 [Cutaneotrichosporon oleaginosum]